MDNEVYDITNINFGILSPDEIRKMSVCRIDNPKNTGPNSVYDQRMGYMPDITQDDCPSCHLKLECWGHFGHIELTEPILHPMYLKSITTFLKCICTKCYKLIVSEEQLELSNMMKLKNDRRFNKLVKKCEKINICSHCSEPHPKIIFKPKDATISLEYKQKKNQKIIIPLEINDIKKIFDNISDEDVVTMGLNPERIHPKNLVITVLPVIPPCSRPYVLADGNMCDDDITYQYIEIVKLNSWIQENTDEEINKLESKLKAKKFEKKNEKKESLKFRVHTLFNNSKGKAKHPTDSRPLRGIKERLCGKGGRFRTNLMGKRVDFSGRTVIDADTTLKVGQFGVPEEMANILTKPEYVTDYNIEWLTELANNGQANFVKTTRIIDGKSKSVRLDLRYASKKSGTQLLFGDIIVRGLIGKLPEVEGKVVIPDGKEREEYEGVKFIKVRTCEEKLIEGDRLVRNGSYVEIKHTEKKIIKLEIGDIVERKMRLGDTIIANRQPTLHKGSMLGVRAVPRKNVKTFSFNLAIAKSYNADFDGDEMNIHFPQSYETEAELKFLNRAEDNIITAQESKPIITITQDSLIAAYLMTQRTHKLTRSEFCDISSKGERSNGTPLFNPNRIKTIQRVLKQFGKKDEVLNGRGLLSLIFPETFNYEKKNNIHTEEFTVIIREGVFLEGALDKSTLGSAHGSIIQILNKEYGPDITSNFIDNIQFLGNAWLLIYGFSIGLEDCMITSEKSILAIKDTLTQCYTKAQGIEETTQNPGIREIRVTASLSQAKDIGMKIAKDAMKPDNNFLVSVKSAAKGDFFNIAQLTGLLGQQNLEGKRVAYQMNHGKRSLPHYPFEGLDCERSYESRGFVRNSFIHGLNPFEFWFHAMSGREGVSDEVASVKGELKRLLSPSPVILGKIPYNVGKILRVLSYHF